MRFMEMLDLRSTRVSGSSVLVHDSQNISVSMGAWTSVRIKGLLHIEFDRDAIWSSSSDLAATPAAEVYTQVIDKAACLMTPAGFQVLLMAIVRAYHSGGNDGREAMQKDLRGMLGL